jgi:hypothetical protein
MVRSRHSRLAPHAISRRGDGAFQMKARLAYVVPITRLSRVMMAS